MSNWDTLFGQGASSTKPYEAPPLSDGEQAVLDYAKNHLPNVANIWVADGKLTMQHADKASLQNMLTKLNVTAEITTTDGTGNTDPTQTHSIKITDELISACKAQSASDSPATKEPEIAL